MCIQGDTLSWKINTAEACNRPLLQVDDWFWWVLLQRDSKANTKANTKADAEANTKANAEAHSEANTKANAEAHSEANTKANA